MKLLDHRDNDIYLLIDKKTDPGFGADIKTRQSKICVIPYDKRIDIRWGGLSQIKAELLLFKTALENGSYDYLHLISGADLPLKPQDYFHQFFENVAVGTNFVSFSHGDAIRQNVEFKIGYFHPFTEYQRYRKDGNLIHTFQDFSAKVIRKTLVKFQQALKITRNWEDLEIRKGSNWVSITSDFARYLTDREKFILKKFKGVICADEIFVQTILYNSPFRHTIRDYDNSLNETLRYIDWQRGTPYVWRESDFDELTKSGALFARKFSSDVDSEIIDKVCSHVLESAEE